MGMTFHKSGALGFDVNVSPDDPLPVTIISGGTPVSVVPAASSTTGGIPSVARLASSAASNNAAVIKASQGQVYYIIAYNAATTTRFLKLYNQATVPNPAIATPVLSIPIPAGGGIALDIHLGLGLFPIGIAMALVQGAADNDNTAVVAADIVGLNIGFA